MEKQLSLFAAAHASPQGNSIKKRPAHGSWKVFVDGASRGNPGPSGAGAYIERDGKAVGEHAAYLGKKTNNQAEYLALIIGAFYLEKLITEYGARENTVTIVADSELLVKQMKGIYKVKNPMLQSLHQLAKLLVADWDPTFTHVLREHNKNADALANKAIDELCTIPTTLTRLLQKHSVDLS